MIGLLADRGWRRRLILGGGVLFAATTAAAGLAPAFAFLLVVETLSYPASGAFVTLAQVTLMDAAPAEREQNMARWTLAGSVGVVAAPLLVAAAAAGGLGWRLVFGVLATLVVVALPAARPLAHNTSVAQESLAAAARQTLALLGRGDVRRWLVLLEATNLLGDVLFGFLALYLVDVAHVTPAQAALAVALWSGAGLAGDAALLVVLRRVPTLRYLRATAVVTAVVYPAFLLAPTFATRLAALAVLGLTHAGWYAIPQARLYEAVGDRSGAVLAIGSLGGLLGSTLPLAIGLLASASGLGAAIWLPLLAPVAVLVGLPRDRESPDRQ